MQQFRGFVIVSFLVLFFLPSHAQQILQVINNPLSPTECDSVQITIQGELPQNNEIKKTQIQQTGNSTEIILVYGQGSSPIPIPTFFENIGVGTLPAGANQLNVLLKNNGFTQDSDNSTIQVSPLNLSSNFTLPTDTVCQRESLVITDGSNEANEYIWQDDGITFDTVASPTYLASDTGKHRIRQVVINGVCRDTTEKSLQVLAAPVAELANSDTQQLCENTVDTLTTNAGYDFYEWRKDGSLISGQDSSLLPITSGGLYQVSTTTSNGCTDSTSIYVEEISTTTPSITKSDSLLSSSPAISYQWLRDGEPIDGATNSTYIAQQSGDFRVVTFTQNGCSDTSAATTVLLTGIPQLHDAEKFATYPIPAQDVLHFTVNTTKINPVSISLHDVRGRSIVEKRLSPSSLQGTIDVDGLANGLYLLQLQTENTTVSKKVVIER